MTVPQTSPRLVVVRAVSMRSNQPSEPRDRGIADGESEAGSEASDALRDEAFRGSEGVSAIAAPRALPPNFQSGRSYLPLPAKAEHFCITACPMRAILPRPA